MVYLKVRNGIFFRICLPPQQPFFSKKTQKKERLTTFSCDQTLYAFPAWLSYFAVLFHFLTFPAVLFQPHSNAPNLKILSMIMISSRALLNSAAFSFSAHSTLPCQVAFCLYCTCTRKVAQIPLLPII